MGKRPTRAFSDTTAPHALSAHISGMGELAMAHYNYATNYRAKHTSDIGDRVYIAEPSVSSFPIPWLQIVILTHKILHQIPTTRRRCSE
jgi:hypothetical protein